MDDDQSSKVDDTGQVQTQPQVTSVSTPVKEQEPILSPEAVRPSDVEPSLHPEVAEVGVEKVREVPALTLEDQRAGLTLAKEATPVPTQPSGIVQFPKSGDEAKKLVRLHNRVADSVRWWLELIVKHFKRMHENIAS